jgi:hypothetical protein
VDNYFLDNFEPRVKKVRPILIKIEFFGVTICLEIPYWMGICNPSAGALTWIAFRAFFRTNLRCYSTLLWVCVHRLGFILGRPWDFKVLHFEWKFNVNISALIQLGLKMWNLIEIVGKFFKPWARMFLVKHQIDVKTLWSLDGAKNYFVWTWIIQQQAIQIGSMI